LSAGKPLGDALFTDITRLIRAEKSLYKEDLLYIGWHLYELASSQALLMVQSEWISGRDPFPTAILFVSVMEMSEMEAFSHLWETINKQSGVGLRMVGGYYGRLLNQGRVCTLPFIYFFIFLFYFFDGCEYCPPPFISFPKFCCPFLAPCSA